MKKFYSTVSKILLLLILMAPISGCDQISTFFSYFSGAGSNKKTSTEKKTATQTKQPEEKFAAAPATTNSPNMTDLETDILAQVGNWTITKEKFDERLQALKTQIPNFDITNVDQNKQILEQLVNQQLLVQDALESGVAQREDIAMALEEARNIILVRAVADEAAGKIQVSEDEAKAYYDQHQQEFVEPAEWHVREIVVESKDEAKNILTELYGGVDFTQMVKDHSKSETAWKKEPGDLGFISTFEFPEMQGAIASLQVGDISGVVSGPKGFYIFKLEEKKGGEAKAFDEIKQDLIYGLTAMKQDQAIVALLDELRQKIDVKVNDNLLEEK